MVATCIPAVACTSSNSTTRTRCGEARRSTTECITRDEPVRCAYVMCFWLMLINLTAKLGNAVGFGCRTLTMSHLFICRGIWSVSSYN